MAVKRSVLEVDVRDSKFKEFYRVYEKYQRSLKAAAPEWAAMGKEQKAQAETIRMMTAALLSQGDILRNQAANQNNIERASRRTAMNWSAISHHAKETANTIYQFAGRVLRWTGIGSAAVGLATGASVWGLERLATSANIGRRSAQGLGLPYGQQSAFTLSYNRMIDAASFLGGVSTARGNIASGAAGALFSLGMNPASGASTGSMAVDALQRIRALATQTPDAELGILLQSRALGELGLSLEDLRRIKGLSAEEFDQYKSEYARRTSQLDLGDKTLKRWQDFDVQLEVAGQKLKNSLIAGLEQLTEPLTKLSDAASDAVQALLGSKGFKWVIDNIAKGLTVFTNYVASDEFKDDIQTFINGMRQLAQDIVAILRFIGVIPGASGGGGAAGTPLMPSYMNPNSALYDPDRIARETRKALDQMFAPAAQLPFNSPAGGLLGPGLGGIFGMTDLERWKKGIAGIESAGHKNPYGALGPVVKSGDRAYGKYQVMGNNIPSWTERVLGRRMSPAEFLLDPDAQEKVFASVFGDYVKRYGEAGAASAWFTGSPHNVNRRDVSDAIPGVHKGISAADYVNRFRQGSRVDININNNTGGSAIVTTSQMVVPQ